MRSPAWPPAMVTRDASLRRQSGAYNSPCHGNVVVGVLPHVRAVRTASLDLSAREGPVEAILPLAVHRGIAL
jgi:hypothetical protein